MDRPSSARAFAIDLAAEPPMRVGAASIDPVSRESIVGDRCERLQPQTLKVLVLLARHRGAVVTREELIEQCWDGRFVGDDVINRSISLLRAFAARAGGFTIETVPKAGYRLVEQPDDAGAAAGTRRRWHIPVAALGVILALVGAAAAWQGRDSGKPGRPSIALVRFTSGPENDTRDLAAASGDALSHMLLDGSFPPRLDWPATLANTTADDFILNGDVRKIELGFAATVQLRDRRSGTLIFSRTYRATGTQVSLLPERIGAEISSNLNGALAMLVLGKGHPLGPDISADMLKQIGLTVSGEDPLAAYGIARRLAERAPDQPQPQLALAFDTGFALGALPRDQRAEAAARGRVAAERTLRMAGDFGDTHVPWCLLHPRTRAIECERRMRAGLKVDPDAPFVPAFLASQMLNVGRFGEALELARGSLTDQPYQPHKLRRVIMLSILLGHDDVAEPLFAKARRWWPDHADIYWDRIAGYALLGDLPGAERAIADTPDSTPGFDRKVSRRLMAAWRSGEASVVRDLCTQANARYTTQALCLTALHKFGDRDTAFKVAETMFPRLSTGTAAGDERVWLDDPYADFDPMLSAPAMKWLRTDPRYVPVIERMGLLAYWRTGALPDFCKATAEPVCAAIRPRPS